MTASGSTYQGTELELFRMAAVWKAYWAAMVAPHVRGRVLEVGAGIGTNAVLLSAMCQHDEWIALEPDHGLCEKMNDTLQHASGPRKVRVLEGDLASLPAKERSRHFDTILYLDVLEHIESDRAEVRLAADALAPGGVLIVLAPAHAWLFSPFDRAIGHFRRYDRLSLRSVVGDAPFEEILIRYLDSCGTVLSAANRVVARRAAPTVSQLLLWDRAVVPISKRVDRLLRYSVGKSILGVWRRK